jgi:hypothetical protein
MTLPWISRSSHEEMMALLTTQVDELTGERRLLLDRLATLGLGGPLFSSPSWPDSSENIADEAEQIDPEAEEIEKLMNLRRRPSKLADALTRKAYRDYNRVQAGPSVKWIPKVEAAKAQTAKLDTITAALDEAEASGKKQA